MMFLNRSRACHFVTGCLTLIAANALALPAFPGAEGAGANATGGRGGSVYYVTNLNDSGPGSLRTGISTGNRTILFKVSGTIDLQSDLKINKPNITIAGQTAPGDGITLRRRLTSVQNTHDVIVRFIRSRVGDLDSSFQDDSFHVVGGTNIMVDHVSSSWSVDECLSVTHSTNVTIQWSMISESLKNSQHVKGAHGYATLLRYGQGQLTFHHNLYQHHDSRNPRLGDNLKLDFVNNVIYDWGGRAGYSGSDSTDLGDNPGGYVNFLNYVNNYLVAGPATGPKTQAFLGGATNTIIFQSGNFIDGNRNGILDGSNTGWSMFSGTYVPSGERYPVPPIDADEARIAYQRVLAFAGASVARDAVDLRLLGTVRNQTGRLVDTVGPNDQASDYVTNTVEGVVRIAVRGWPVLNSVTPPIDSDNDGIPDYFESALGWNPNFANNNHTNADGYTDLEWYLNWLAEPHAITGFREPVEINLRALTGENPDLQFFDVASTNGLVVLQPDGFTAQFVPATNFTGLTQFTFSVTNTADHVAFGSVAVTVLVSNSPPVFSAIPDQTVIAGATLSLTNRAETSDALQPLTFSLLNAPAGAALNSTSGNFTWRPAINQSGTTNLVRIVATDSGSPSLSATQTFNVIVNAPVQPRAEVSVAGSQLSLWITGDFGPDYFIEASTNLLNWDSVFATNSPVLPFLWSDIENTNFHQRFYRIRLGP